jgi:hypothetical protein
MGGNTVRRFFGITLGIALCALAVFAVASSALAEDGHEHGAMARAFDAVLTGPGEVPPTTSTGEGLASFLLSQDASTLFYTLETSGASSTVNAAHIHLARAGHTGDVVVNLCGAGSAPACSTEGVIATGSITSSSLVGPLAGHSLSDLLSAMRSGGTYANVHTANFPSGELRGQIQPLGTRGEQQGHQNNDENHNGDHQDSD